MTNASPSSVKDALETARQINLIRDGLSQVLPSDAIYDINNPETPTPWAGNISPIVTSCGNLYLTSDGKDLLFELVSILTYCAYVGTSVSPA
ncbi:Imm70 family immunity protein [Slackia heliotrinireducens]|uniref:Imm70 family immunity protein n=1 Tax=Slackia heliotrinireducens TaxID=84110 RepID=UPI00145C9F2C